MTLADSSVVIKYLRLPTARLSAIITNQQAAICGVTVAEVYAGARNAAELTRFQTDLSIFGTISTAADVWGRLGQNLFQCNRKGLPLPFADVLIATIALDNGLEVWTHDAHFQTMQAALPALRLFQEPP